MENTSALLFDGKKRRFFLAQEGRAQGPLTAKDVFERISRKECSVAHFIWEEGWKDWRRILEVPEFAVLVPQAPSQASLAKIQSRLLEEKNKQAKSSETKKSANPSKLGGASSSDASWFVFAHGTQFGPFSQAELLQSLQNQNVGESDFVWRQGWGNWKPLGKVDELMALRGNLVPPSLDFAPPPVPAQKSDRRRNPRKPFVAKLFIHNEKDLVIAMCRDISMGGMQVLTDRIPGELGEKIKLNVSAAASGGASNGSDMKGFVAEGEIVRLLEDGRGFSFRFTKLSPEAKKAIDGYLKNSP